MRKFMLRVIMSVWPEYKGLAWNMGKVKLHRDKHALLKYVDTFFLNGKSFFFLPGARQNQLLNLDNISAANIFEIMLYSGIWAYIEK